MANAVAGDPYGIGFCSSACIDLDCVAPIAVKSADGNVWYYPSADPEKRWHRPMTLNHPFVRTLYVAFGGKAWTPGKPCFGSEMLAPGSPGMTALQAGPLYMTGYYAP